MNEKDNFSMGGKTLERKSTLTNRLISGVFNEQ